MSAEAVENILVALTQKVAQIDCYSDQAEVESKFNSLDLELVLETVLSLSSASDSKIMVCSLSLIKELNLATINLEKAGVQIQSLFFALELACQVSSQVIEHNKAKDAHTLRVQKPGEQVLTILHLAHDLLDSTVKDLLAIKDVDAADPFNQFMQVVDQESEVAQDQDPSGRKADLLDRIMSLFQTTKSLYGLLLKIQWDLEANISRSVVYLSTQSKLILSLRQKDESQSMKYAEMTGRLLRFYHANVIKTLEASTADGSHEEVLPTQKANTQDVISTYVHTVLSVAKANEDSATTTELERQLIQMVSSAGYGLYSHIIIYLLLVESKGSVSIS